MKSTHHTGMSDVLDNRMKVSNQKVSVPRSKLSAGSVVNKHPVVLDDGRTIVFISDKSREREIRLRYALKKGY
jgi:Tol biopolymer transport system component